MFNTYDDITSRIAEPPIWFDEYSVPRYCPFSPDRSVSIYIHEIALMEIACQRCGRIFKVAISAANFSESTIADAIRSQELHYRDPPNVGCCPGGACENSVPKRVLEYWFRGDPRYLDGRRIIDMAYFEWVRDSSLEIAIERNA